MSWKLFCINTVCPRKSGPDEYCALLQILFSKWIVYFNNATSFNYRLPKHGFTWWDSCRYVLRRELWCKTSCTTFCNYFVCSQSTLQQKIYKMVMCLSLLLSNHENHFLKIIPIILVVVGKGCFTIRVPHLSHFWWKMKCFVIPQHAFFCVMNKPYIDYIKLLTYRYNLSWIQLKKNILYMDCHWRIFGEDSFWRNSDLHFSNTCYLNINIVYVDLLLQMCRA